MKAHYVQNPELRKGGGKHCGNNCEVFGDVIGNGEGGKRSARDEKLLTNLNYFNELGGVGVQINHIAGFFRCLGAGVHGYANIGLSERGRVVGAVASHGDKFALSLLLPDQRHLVFRLGFGKEIVHASLAGDSGGGQWVVGGGRHGANVHGGQVVEAFAHASLDNVR